MPIPKLSSVLCQKLSLGPQNVYTNFFRWHDTLLASSQDKYSINCSSLRHKAKLHFINRHYSMKHFFQHPFHHHHTMLKKLHTSIAAAVPDVTRYSAGMKSILDFLIYFNHHLNSYSPLVAVNSSDTSEGPTAFPVFI